MVSVLLGSFVCLKSGIAFYSKVENLIGIEVPLSNIFHMGTVNCVPSVVLCFKVSHIILR